ncbi:MAG: hypothetical protein ACREYE_13450 [Gammaproteobacteria bacterium]
MPSGMAPVNKLLAFLGDHPVIRHVVQTTLDASPVIVVVGYDREALRAALDRYGWSTTTTIERAWLRPSVPVFRRS